MSTLNDDQIDQIRNKLQVVCGSVSLLRATDDKENMETIINRMDEALNKVIKVLNEELK